MKSRPESGRRDVPPGLVLGLLAALVFVLVWLLETATPLLADDYTFAFDIASGTRIRSLAGVLHSAGVGYQVLNGRILGTGLAQAFMLIGKPVFNVANGLAFVAVAFLVSAIASGTLRPKPLAFAATALLLWFALPSFGESVLWLSGAANYLWPTLPVLGALLVVRLHAGHPGGPPRQQVLASAGALVLGILAGVGNENVGPALLLVLGAYAVLVRRDERAVPAWLWSLMAGVAGGAVLSIAAPGNRVRLGFVDAPALTPAVLLDRVATVTHAIFLDNLFVLLAVFAVGVVFVRHFPGKERPVALRMGGLLAAGALLATYAMVLSPQFPPRAWTGIIVLAVSAVVTVFADLPADDRFLRSLARVALVAGVALFATRYAYVYARDLRPTNAAWRARIAFVREREAAGDAEVTVAPIAGLTTYDPASTIEDLGTDPAGWPNKDVARYYGVVPLKASDDLRESR